MQKVLIISGGGIYGLIPTYFLSEISPTDLNKIDVIAGTSVGGILALYLITHSNLSSLYEDFVQASPQIFHRSILRVLNPFASRYSSKNIEKILKNMIPGKVADTHRKFVIPTFGFKKEQPVIFHNLDDSYHHMDLWKIARATSAAPLYFPPYSENILIDGGILENIPIITTATMIKRYLNISHTELDVFVIGTGKKDIDMSKTIKQVNKYTHLDWAKKLLPIITTGGNEMMSNFWGQYIGFHSFNMFNPIIIDGKMDDAEVIKSGRLEDKCDIYLSEFKKEWNRFINLI